MRRPTNSDQLHGTLDMLVLKVLEGGALHGYAIAVRLERTSNDVLSVEEGSLYPALYRMEAQGLIKAHWGVSDKNRKARFYKLTNVGRRHLAAEQEHWSRVSKGIELVLSQA